MAGTGGAGTQRGGYGVYGHAGGGAATAGVAGYNDSNVALGVGVRGTIPSSVTAVPTAGVYGECLSTAAGSAGVSGYSTNGHGVQGTTAGGNGVYGSSATGYGVVGYSTGGSASLAGVSDHTNIPAFAGGNSAPGGLAAHFGGTVYVDCTAGGQFVVNPMSAKSGLLQHPDGSHRLMYSVEAPESWAEDFGAGSLVGGKAEVKLDPDFAAVIHTDNYHVFVTGHDEMGEGLVVTARGANSFTVKERKGGTSGGTFSWRLVAKPRVEGHVAVRLAKYDIPAPLHLPTADELKGAVGGPKAASSPTAKKP